MSLLDVQETDISRSQDEDLGYNNGGNAKGVLTVAAILIHRFYMRRSINDFPPEVCIYSLRQGKRADDNSSWRRPYYLSHLKSRKNL